MLSQRRIPMLDLLQQFWRHQITGGKPIRPYLFQVLPVVFGAIALVADAGRLAGIKNSMRSLVAGGKPLAVNVFFVIDQDAMARNWVLDIQPGNF